MATDTRERTFQHQKTLPKLPVPELNQTLDRYLKSACVLLTEKEKEETRKKVEKFRNSPLAQQLQQALKARADQEDNWLDDWWYDAYCEVRQPIIPYLSVASIQARAPRMTGSQLHRAADATYHMMRVWQQHRNQDYPVMRSRGTVWDMTQNYCLFNSCRVPDIPKDYMARYFRTEEEGPCPSNVIVLCRGNIWNIEMLKNGRLQSPDELFKIFQFIQEHSDPKQYCIATLTTEHRDNWAKLRKLLITQSETNAESLSVIEKAAFVVSLTDDEILDENELLTYSMMGRSNVQWADKSMSIQVMRDGQICMQADHSNADAIVFLDASNTSGKSLRHHLWTPKDVDIELPKLIEFELDSTLRDAIVKAEQNFQDLKKTIGVRVMRYNSYGNDTLKKMKIYGDTVVQLAMQIAYAKTHDKQFAPIYETASTRKFYKARTETIRGRTEEMINFGRAVLENEPIEKQRRLLKLAYDAHNALMADAMEAQGCDRHLYGLRKTLEIFNRGGCNPKRPLPELFTDKAWRHSGGDGNFKLSTSFIGYDKGGSYGYVCAMCPDGYGSFYKLHDDSLLLTATNFKGQSTDLVAYTTNIAWALDRIGALLGVQTSKL